MDITRILEWCNHWCLMLNPSKTKELVVSGCYRTANPPHGDLVLFVVSICTSLNLNILGVKFDCRLLQGIVSCVSQWIGILRLVKRVFVDTSVLLHCYYAFLLLILEYCSPAWGFAAECHHQLHECQVLCHDHNFFSLCHRHHVAALCMLSKINLNLNHCLFSELPSASVRVWDFWVVAAAHPLEQWWGIFFLPRAIFIFATWFAGCTKLII